MSLHSVLVRHNKELKKKKSVSTGTEVKTVEQRKLVRGDPCSVTALRHSRNRTSKNTLRNAIDSRHNSRYVIQIVNTQCTAIPQCPTPLRRVYIIYNSGIGTTEQTKLFRFLLRCFLRCGYISRFNINIGLLINSFRFSIKNGLPRIIVVPEYLLRLIMQSVNSTFLMVFVLSSMFDLQLLNFPIRIGKMY